MYILSSAIPRHDQGEPASIIYILHRAVLYLGMISVNQSLKCTYYTEQCYNVHITQYSSISRHDHCKSAYIMYITQCRAMSRQNKCNSASIMYILYSLHWSYMNNIAMCNMYIIEGHLFWSCLRIALADSPWSCLGIALLNMYIIEAHYIIE